MAIKTVSTGGGNWNSAATWSPSGVPATTDDVRFSSTSSFLNVNVASTCATIDFTNYTNAITMSAGLQVNGGVTFISGLKVGGTSGLTIGGTGTLTSNGFEWPNNLTIGNTTSYTVTLADNVRVSGSLIFAAAAGTATLNNNNIYVSGGLSIGKVQAGSTTIQLVGTGTWSGSVSLLLPLVVNTAGTISVPATVTKSTGNFTWTAGSLNAAGGTLVIAGSSTYAIGAVTWNNLQINGGATTTLAENINVGGNFTSNGGSITINGAAYLIDVAGSYIYTIGNITGTSAIRLNGSGTISQGLNYTTQIALVLSGSGNYELRTTGTETRAIHKTGNPLIYERGTFTGTGSIQIGQAGGAAMTMSLLNPMSFNRLIVLNPITLITGSGGFHVNHFSGSTAGSRIIFQSGSRYSVTSSLQLLGTAASPIIITSSLANSSSIFTLVQGAAQNVAYITATDIDSSEGQTIWDYNGTLTRTVNWNAFDNTAPQGSSYTWVS